MLNIVATYGIPRASIHRRNAAPQGPLWVVRAAKQALYGVRSVYGAVLGLFTARWVLTSFGQIDYGVFGVVGGMAGRWLDRGEIW